MNTAKNIVVLTFTLVLLHLAIALLPWYFNETRATALLLYHSYYTVASVLQQAGLPVIGEFREGMFMAPITTTGHLIIAVFWLLIHTALAVLLRAAYRLRTT